MSGLKILGKIQKHQTGRIVIPIAAYHNPKRPCWLWCLDIQSVISDEKRAIRFIAMPGHQSRYIFQLWRWSLNFLWQEEGRYKTGKAYRQSKLAKMFGVRMDK